MFYFVVAVAAAAAAAVAHFTTGRIGGNHVRSGARQAVAIWISWGKSWRDAFWDGN